MGPQSYPQSTILIWCSYDCLCLEKIQQTIHSKSFDHGTGHRKLIARTHSFGYATEHHDHFLNHGVSSGIPGGRGMSEFPSNPVIPGAFLTGYNGKSFTDGYVFIY